MRSICCVCCGDLHKLPLWRLQRRWSLVTLGCTWALKGIWPLGVQWGKSLKGPKLVDNWPIFTIHISFHNNFSLEIYFADCIVIAKNTMAENTMALIFWQNVATDCIKTNTNRAPFEEIRQDKINHWINIPKDTAAGQTGWPTEVAEMWIAIANHVSTIRGPPTSCIFQCVANLYIQLVFPGRDYKSDALPRWVLTWAKENWGQQ